MLLSSPGGATGGSNSAATPAERAHRVTDGRHRALCRGMVLSRATLGPWRWDSRGYSCQGTQLYISGDANWIRQSHTKEKQLVFILQELQFGHQRGVVKGSRRTLQESREDQAAYPEDLSPPSSATPESTTPQQASAARPAAQHLTARPSQVHRTTRCDVERREAKYGVM